MDKVKLTATDIGRMAHKLGVRSDRRGFKGAFTKRSKERARARSITRVMVVLIRYAAILRAQRDEALEAANLWHLHLDTACKGNARMREERDQARRFTEEWKNRAEKAEEALGAEKARNA